MNQYVIYDDDGQQIVVTEKEALDFMSHEYFDMSSELLTWLATRYDNSFDVDLGETATECDVRIELAEHHTFGIILDPGSWMSQPLYAKYFWRFCVPTHETDRPEGLYRRYVITEQHGKFFHELINDGYVEAGAIWLIFNKCEAHNGMESYTYGVFLAEWSLGPGLLKEIEEDLEEAHA